MFLAQKTLALRKMDILPYCFLLIVNLLWTTYCQSEQKFIVTKLDIDTDVRYRFAETLYTITVFNPSNNNHSYLVVIPFPKEAFVTNFTIEIDGTIFVSNVVEKKDETTSNQDNEDIDNYGRFTQFVDANSFVIPVDIPSKTDVKITLTYQEMLRRRKGVYDIRIMIGHCENGYNTDVKLSITESKALTDLHVSPQWQTTTKVNKALHFVRPNNETATLKYNTVSNNDQCLRQIHVKYDVERSPNAGEILIEDGFFVHFLAPTGLKAIPKDIVFILDTSRSMQGEPIEELQRAMTNILDRLGGKDRFNIIVFQSTFGLFESELQNSTSESIENAKNMIRFQAPEGGTNIHDGLLAGIKMLHSMKVKEIRSPIIIFFTDGQASSGITNRDLIIERVRSRNVLGIPIFSISLGKNADIKLSSKVASQNFGFTRHIYNTSMASSVIHGLYEDVATTLLKHIDIVYLDNVVNNQTVTQTNFRTLFNRSEIVTSGKLNNESTTFLKTYVAGVGKSGLTSLSNASVSVIENEGGKNTIAEIWKHRRLKELMRLRDVVDDPVLASALQKTFLTMSLQYNYVTPLTVVIVEKDGKVQSSKIVDNDDKVIYAAAYKPPENPKKRKQKRNRFSGKGDPHFEMNVEGIEYPICFDIKAAPGSILRILHIPKVLVLNIGIKPETVDYREDKLYISDIFASTHGHDILLNIDSGILYKGHMYAWSNITCQEKRENNLTLCFDNKSSVIAFEFNEEVSLHVERKVHKGIKYFNFYVQDFWNLSSDCSGLLGSLLNKEFKLGKIVKRNRTIIGNFRVKIKGTDTYDSFTAKLKQKQRSSSNTDICWHLHKKIKGLIDSPQRFCIQSLFHSDIL